MFNSCLYFGDQADSIEQAPHQSVAGFVGRSRNAFDFLAKKDSGMQTQSADVGRLARTPIERFLWGLSGTLRLTISLIIGLLIAALVFRMGWEYTFLCAYVVFAGCYLGLLLPTMLSGDAALTEARASRAPVSEARLFVVVVVIAFVSNAVIGVLLTAVGHRAHGDAQRLLWLSVAAVGLSWTLLLTSFAVFYARSYFHGSATPGGRGGFEFVGTAKPAAVDFLYVAATIALSYAMSDVTATNSEMRRIVMLHSVISFLFFSTVLSIGLNALLTS